MKKIVKQSDFKIKDYLVDTKAKDLDDIKEIPKEMSLETLKEISVEEREMELTKELNLKKQLRIRKMRSLGFSIIKRDFAEFFGTIETIDSDIDYYNGLIPLLFLIKIKEYNKTFQYFRIREEKNIMGRNNYYRILYGGVIDNSGYYYIDSIGQLPDEDENKDASEYLFL